MAKKTIENLKAAFAGESQARNKYTFFAKVARKEGYLKLAEVFEETAENEKKHAELILRLLGEIGDTRENLKQAIDGETYEFTDMYPQFLKVAEEEGEEKAASYFKNVIVAEKNHASVFRKMLEKLDNDTFLKSDNPDTGWRCSVCGYVHQGIEPPEKCPLCNHPKEFFNEICK